METVCSWETLDMTQSSRERVTSEFRRRFGADPTGLVRAPGRVNLIGEHTDYNDGFVMPLAIDRWVWLAVRPREDRHVHLCSVDFDDAGAFSLDALTDPGRHWSDYAKGVAWALSETGAQLDGFDGAFVSNVPVGAGLSSSAALEMAVARAFALVSNSVWDARSMAHVCQRAENRWIGVNCGIMDQLISAGGVLGHAVLIDCRSLEMRPFPLSADAVVVVLDTSTRRRLDGSEYNDRRAQCVAAARVCGASSLRDVGSEVLRKNSGAMDPVALRRASHVLSENERTLAAAEALRGRENKELGALMHASHLSLRDDFEVSTPALDIMVESALASPGCHGARLTGAGFGGCVVALVERERVGDFSLQATARFSSATGFSPSVYVCEAVNGAEVVDLV
jgi:galactokinase